MCHHAWKTVLYTHTYILYHLYLVLIKQQQQKKPEKLDIRRVGSAVKSTCFCFVLNPRFLCRPGWPQTQRSTCLCLLSAGIKGMCHRAWPKEHLSLTEDPGSIPCTHMMTLLSVAPAPGVFNTFSDLGAPGLHVVCLNTCKQSTCTHKAIKQQRKLEM